ncbi:RNA polymerase factor sigma-54 [Halochromatium salexigens]|uniref:RNA polymerase sigma-54 factor n=1 Tax=Halochromatium salexigens TaxID=49447 RepID=A0AAJ0UHM8_HALSE|nr:RNA polymerase factor sigma-54 [Halochromatium salexigens]MBK5931639.1 RNA polymerase factor sigma-54 [Halochromatium salexigens]
MKQSIQLRLGQQLTMTPQLQQAIKLLQLSTLDLQREIQDALESNLMLETADEGETEREGAPAETRESERQRHEADAAVDAEVPAESNALPDDLPLDSDWNDTYDGETSEQYAGPSAAAGGGSDHEVDLFAQQSRPQTLHDHLEWQLNLGHLGARDRLIAEALIDAIDADGYLRLDPAELLETLDLEDLERDEIEAVLHAVQALDPPGIGARDPRECLLLQLRQLPAETPHRAGALMICEKLFDALSRNDLDELRRHTKLSDLELGRALALIRSLQPRPGALMSEHRPDYVIPDVLVRKRAGSWQVELNPDTQPKLRVNEDYVKLIRRADDGAENTCLKTHLQEARWFIKSLLSRNDTVLKVAAKIVELQHDFFEYGEEAMRPLILRDVADSLELHESTVSRVTTQKYMHTPRGTLEFKYFFSSHVGTAAGGECSSTAIRAFIRKLVAAETANKPLSDSKIAGILSEQGINVARRTVAKYREAMGIPPSNERKRL